MPNDKKSFDVEVEISISGIFDFELIATDEQNARQRVSEDHSIGLSFGPYHSSFRALDINGRVLDVRKGYDNLSTAFWSPLSWIEELDEDEIDDRAYTVDYEVAGIWLRQVKIDALDQEDAKKIASEGKIKIVDSKYGVERVLSGEIEFVRIV